MVAVDVSLNFMPAFFVKHAGVRYGEGYYFDPQHRADIEKAEGKFLNECLGRYGAGSPDPKPSPSLFIQPVDVIMRTQGAEWRLPEDATLESWGTPWGKMSPDEIAVVSAADAAAHPIIDNIIAQYRTLEKMYGARADIFWSKSGTMGIHSPYTTALQLCGDELFVIMLTEQEAASRIFLKVWEIYQAIYGRIQNVTGARFSRVNIGDCSAAMISEDIYRSGVLPVNKMIASQFRSAGYHSCGGSTHLLRAFAEIPGVDAIELGPGTDLAEGVNLMSKTMMRPLIDPKIVRDGTPDDVHSLVRSVIADTSKAPGVTLCAWSFDKETPIENVAEIYKVVEQNG